MSENGDQLEACPVCGGRLKIRRVTKGTLQSPSLRTIRYQLCAADPRHYDVRLD